uniref:Uncharacterized protein n=1 Tax=Ditylum brightwellii TaxID=49249 RepID=A0A7S4T8Q1_9STRA|mmetsp:Transcript_18155/g.24204  ORF Transcript_18155/g.24204 Transcript_18155/m.24204 type:complete len:175 (-) Transcript_18155:305-829(-)
METTNTENTTAMRTSLFESSQKIDEELNRRTIASSLHLSKQEQQQHLRNIKTQQTQLVRNATRKSGRVQNVRLLNANVSSPSLDATSPRSISALNTPSPTSSSPSPTSSSPKTKDPEESFCCAQSDAGKSHYTHRTFHTFQTSKSDLFQSSSGSFDTESTDFFQSFSSTDSDDS